MPPQAPSKPAAKTSFADHPILFQKFFKSVGTRTYAAQVKRASNGNHYLVITEGRRDDASGEVKKIRLFLYSEDFVDFFRMLHETAQWIKSNPVPENVKKKRQAFWNKQNAAAKPAAAAGSATPARATALAR